MSRAVLISIKPEWCGMIVLGEKTTEIRKTRPKIELPFKCYIYCTLPKNSGDIYLVGGENPVQGNGKVIGEFLCDEIIDYYPIDIKDPINKPYGEEIEKVSCLTTKEVNDYGYRTLGYGKLYGWHISDLVIYDKPRELSKFRNCHCCVYAGVCNDECWSGMKKPPQSWCYVEEPDNV